MDYVDDLHNVFNHAYRFQWRRDGEADLTREATTFNWDGQVTRYHAASMLAMLEVAVNQDAGRSALLEFYGHVRYWKFIGFIVSTLGKCVICWLLRLITQLLLTCFKVRIYDYILDFISYFSASCASDYQRRRPQGRIPQAQTAHTEAVALQGRRRLSEVHGAIPGERVHTHAMARTPLWYETIEQTFSLSFLM
jgi:hypothetical protein